VRPAGASVTTNAPPTTWPAWRPRCPNPREQAQHQKIGRRKGKGVKISNEQMTLDVVALVTGEAE
jgi:hypothetical protein